MTFRLWRRHTIWWRGLRIAILLTFTNIWWHNDCCLYKETQHDAVPILECTLGNPCLTALACFIACKEPAPWFRKFYILLPTLARHDVLWHSCALCLISNDNMFHMQVFSLIGWLKQYENGQISFQNLDPALLIPNMISGFMAIFWCGNEQSCV